MAVPSDVQPTDTKQPAPSATTAPPGAAWVPGRVAVDAAASLPCAAPLRRLGGPDLARIRESGRVWRAGDDAGDFGVATTRAESRVQLQRVVVGRSRVVLGLIVALWAFVNLLFWAWWLTPANVENVWLFFIFSAVFFYDVTFLPTMYLYFVSRMARPKYLAAPRGLKVALITLCVPSSESLAVIARQLEALARVRYPHDSWVLDEGGSLEVQALAARLGVRYFTRKGIERYNRPDPPFKAKTKAGNVNAWLDQHGHEYDIFVQFDIDHRPREAYLDRVLGYFRDPRVAWVQAPSLYGNLDNWVARGAAEQELVLQGPLQQGFFGNSETPFIIGSHCTYRTSAIQEIGGFQPTRAEDHLDTVMLASRGYRGVFVPEVLAVGNGPDTFETYLRQQFAWAYSMIQVLFTWTPRLIGRYRPLQGMQFLFAQTWYTCWSASMAVLFLLPALVLTTNLRPSGVGLAPFVAVSLPVHVTAFAIWWWTRRWHLPEGLRLSWRGVVLHVARWPIVLWALLNVVLRVRHPYMITPKGTASGLPAFSLRSQALYLLATWLVIAVVWIFGPWDPLGFVAPRLHDDGTYDSEGFIVLAFWGVAFVLLVFVANVFADLVDLRGRRVSFLRILRLRYRPLGMLLATGLVFAMSLQMNAHVVSYATRWDGLSPIDAATTGPDRAMALLRQAAGREALAVPPLVGDASSRAAGVAADLLTGHVVMGAYDPWQRLQTLSLELDHWYVSQTWAWLTRGALRQSQGRAVMLSFGPNRRPLQMNSPLQETVDGARDEQLRRLAAIVAQHSDRVILLRWGHNMDVPGLESWGGESPALYRAAFRHVVELFRAEGATGARWVWSPSGQPGFEAYYPGDDVVDYVGISIFEDEGWDAALGTGPMTFAEHVDRLYPRLQALGKPVIVAELGVSGDSEYQRTWLADASAALPAYPLIRAISYFADVAPPSPFFTTRPDWQITPDVMAESFAIPALEVPPDPTGPPPGHVDEDLRAT